MSVKLLTEHHFEFLSLKGGCTGSSESTLVKLPVLEITCRGSCFLLCQQVLCLGQCVQRDMWRFSVRSAMHGASQLAGREPTDVDDAPASAH